MEDERFSQDEALNPALIEKEQVQQMQMTDRAMSLALRPTSYSPRS